MDTSMNKQDEIFPCHLCCSKFFLKKSLDNHLRIHAREDPFVCDTCGRACSDKKLLIAHLRIHSKKRGTVCEMCKKGFTDKMIFIEHVLMHTEREPFFCKAYEMEFTKESVVKDIDDVYAKEFCTDKDTKEEEIHTYEIYEMGNMIRHVRFHTKEKESICRICTPHLYDYRNEIEFHACSARVRGLNETRALLTESPIKDKEENISSAEFSKELREILTSYSMTGTEKQSCSFDESSAEYSQRKISSKRLPSYSRVKTLTCNTCKKDFYGRYALLAHLHTHTERKPFSCKICNEEFSYKTTLKRHLCQFHPYEMPFICEICRKSFFHKNRIITHLRTHTEGRAVVCDTCKKGTYQKYNRDVHVRKHTKEKPFMCDIHERVFSDMYNIIKHVRFHPEDKASSCEICNKG